MVRYILRVLSDGDIDIISNDDNSFCNVIYHKTYNPDENIIDNLIVAFKQWEKLSINNYKESVFDVWKD